MRFNRKLIIIITILLVLALFGFLFFKFNGRAKITDFYFKITTKSQTVGEVTVNRDLNSIKITKINDPFWDNKTISPIIGDAYKIDRLKNDGRPVHVEFAYDPNDIPANISPADLHLFKWHDENGKKYWSQIKSQVDKKKHIVFADLNSFSVLAIKAPLTSYLSSAEINEIKDRLKSMQENPPSFACGFLAVMEEELVTDEFDWQRTGDDNIIEIHDCWANGKVEPRAATFYFSRIKDGKSFTYVADALLAWQIDPSESITLDGWVVNQDGEPVEKAQVIAQKTKYGSWQQKTTTDKNGYYKLKIHSGEYTFKVISRDAKCSIVSANNQFCYQGNIWEEPITRSQWQKNFTMSRCGNYELTITSKIIKTTPIPGLAPSVNTSEVHGSATITAAKDNSGVSGDGSITIDKFTNGIAQGVECKQTKPVLYKFKVSSDSLSTRADKELSLTLDFSENDWDVPEEAYTVNLIYDPTDPADAQNAKKGAEDAKKYNNYECDYTSSWAGHLGIFITSDEWLGDFVDIHSDEGLNGTAIRSATIFAIKDWEIVNRDGVWARKSYQREKDLYGNKQSAVEETTLELRQIKN